MKKKSLVKSVFLSALLVFGAPLARADNVGVYYAHPNASTETSYATDGTNIFTGPGTRFNLQGRVARGEKLYLLGCEEALDWCLIEQRDGTRGWLEAHYLRAGYGRNYSIFDMNADGNLHILIFDAPPSPRRNYTRRYYHSYPNHPHHPPRPRPDHPNHPGRPDKPEKPEKPPVAKDPFAEAIPNQGGYSPHCPMGVSKC